VGLNYALLWVGLGVVAVVTLGWGRALIPATVAGVGLGIVIAAAVNLLTGRE
jgi:hypothetical protein